MSNRACPRKDGGVCPAPDPVSSLLVRDGMLVTAALATGSDHRAEADMGEGDRFLTVDPAEWKRLAPGVVGAKVFDQIRAGNMEFAVSPIRLRGFESVENGIVVQCSPCGDIWIVPVN